MARSSRGESGLSVALAVVWLRASVSTACCALAAIRWWKGRLVRGALRHVKRERREHREVEGRSVDGVVVAAAMVAIVSVSLRKLQPNQRPNPNRQRDLEIGRHNAKGNRIRYPKLLIHNSSPIEVPSHALLRTSMYVCVCVYIYCSRMANSSAQQLF